MRVSTDHTLLEQVLRVLDRHVYADDLRMRDRAPINELRDLVVSAQQAQTRRDLYGVTDEEVVGCSSCGIRVSRCPECGETLDRMEVENEPLEGSGADAQVSQPAEVPLADWERDPLADEAIDAVIVDEQTPYVTVDDAVRRALPTTFWEDWQREVDRITAEMRERQRVCHEARAIYEREII